MARMGTTKSVRVMITGHRPQYMDRQEQATTRQLLRLALQRLQLRHPDMVLLSGMAIGADQWAAEAALSLGIPVEAAVPFKGQEDRWAASQQAHYRHLLTQCAEVHVLSDAPYHPSLYLMRNQWLVNHANLALAVWSGVRSGGTWDAIKRIHDASLPCLHVWPDSGINPLLSPS